MADKDVLSTILASLADLKASHAALDRKIDSLAHSHQQRTPTAAPTPTSPSLLSTSPGTQLPPPISIIQGRGAHEGESLLSSPPLGGSLGALGSPGALGGATPKGLQSPSLTAKKEAGSPYGQRVILTTYPGQVGIHPIPLKWGAPSAQERGPVLASRQPASVKIRNSIGAYAGSYSIYRALAVAIGAIDPNHRPDYTNTSPPYPLPPQPTWSDPKKIVSFDPWGHLIQDEFKEFIERGIDVRPTIAVTKAHLKIAELDDAVKAGRLPLDGKIVIQSQELPVQPDGKRIDPGVEVNTSKAAIEPVWYLPGVAERFGISEGTLRRALFEDTGGMYPELLTRHDLKVFLPPIGGATIYIFGPTQYLTDESKELTLRVHDECNGSDVFGSDICTCRPYLLFGIEEAVKTAQNGGVGVIVYFRKEGRALGEVTKYLVYNARKRGGDSAAKYFASTENVAGVKDMRFQALMPDVLHFLGIKKIDNMISMSDMKYNAIVDSGISIKNRYDIPAHLIPPDGQVEIQAKIHAGYFSSKGSVVAEDLAKTHGRMWEGDQPPTPAAVWEDLQH